MQNQNFPSYDEAWSAETRLTENFDLYARMPWVLPGPVRDRQLTTRYGVSGLLPCGTPISATMSHDWLNRIAIPDTSLNLHVFGSFGEARVGHVQSIVARHGRHSTPLVANGRDVNVDAYAYRTQGEIDYVRRLRRLDVTHWRGEATVSRNALCWTAPIIRREFWYISKIHQVFWQWAA